MVEGLLGVQVVAVEDELHGDGVGELAVEAVGGAEGGEDAAPDFGQAEEGLRGGDAEVGDGEEGEAGAEAIAVDSGDDGLPDADAVVEAAATAGLEDVGHAAAGVAGLAGARLVGDGLLEVGAGAEGFAAGAGDDGDPDVWVVADFMPGLGEGVAGFRVDRVHGFGTVEGDGGDAVLQVEEDGIGVGHGGLLGGALAGRAARD